MAIDVEKELGEANARLPINMDSTSVPLKMQMRAIALTLAERYVADTCVKEGALYNALKMDNKIGNVVSLDDVIKGALVFERYLWGEWSKGIAENAMESVLTDAADILEDEFRKRRQQNVDEDESPIRPSSGGSV